MRALREGVSRPVPCSVACLGSSTLLLRAPPRLAADRTSRAHAVPPPHRVGNGARSFPPLAAQPRHPAAAYGSGVPRGPLLQRRGGEGAVQLGRLDGLLAAQGAPTARPRRCRGLRGLCSAHPSPPGAARACCHSGPRLHLGQHGQRAGVGDCVGGRANDALGRRRGPVVCRGPGGTAASAALRLVYGRVDSALPR